MKVRVIADGEIRGTRILTDSGEDITEFSEMVSFRHEGGQIPQIELRLALLPADVAGAVVAIHALAGKTVRRIEYTDGTSDEFPPAPAT